MCNMISGFRLKGSCVAKKSFVKAVEFELLLKTVIKEKYFD